MQENFQVWKTIKYFIWIQNVIKVVSVENIKSVIMHLCKNYINLLFYLTLSQKDATCFCKQMCYSQ